MTSMDMPPIKIRPPNTASLSPIIRIDRGSDFHGSHDESWYLVESGYGTDDEPQFHLWVAVDASQEPDAGAPVIYLMAWLDEEFENGNIIDRMAAEQMLVFAYIQAVKEDFGDDHYHAERFSQGPNSSLGKTEFKMLLISIIN